VPHRLLIASALVLLAVAVDASGAAASDITGGNGGTAAASSGPGTVTVGVGTHHHRRTNPTSADTAPTTSTPPSGDGKSDPRPTTNPVTCTIKPVNLVQFQEILGPGPNGETGYWALDICNGPNGPIPHPPVWIEVAQPGTPATPGTNTVTTPPPVVVAQQAVKQIDLPSTGIEMAPPTTSPQLVNVSTWLWLDAATWKTYTATASIAGVSATATATPEKVIWNMGDGNAVTCDGPGTPYDPSQPNATTTCSYTWSAPSNTQTGGVYQVTATIEWQVTWTAVGAAGGGNLGLVPGPADRVAIQVTESQAINTPTNQAAPASSGAGGS
jgi:uncharacterized Zn-finger protein